MNMKEHILAGVREQYASWEELLAGLDESQINTPLSPSKWTIKDTMAHLWVWELRSVARVEAAVTDREPIFRGFPDGYDPDAEGTLEQSNTWIYDSNRDVPWSQVIERWRSDCHSLLENAQKISEKDMLDTSRYHWLNGANIALVLVSSYDHHQEHREKLIEWLHEHGVKTKVS